MNTCTIAAHELARLIESDRMLKHLIERCTYLEDGRISGKINEADCWMADDEDRSNLPLTSYLEIRLRGEHVPEFWPIEMSLEQARNHSEQVKRGRVTWTVEVDGSEWGQFQKDGKAAINSNQEPEDRRDYEMDAKREEMEPRHYAVLLFPHQEP